MRIGEIKCPPGSRRERKRRGQGPGSGNGKTAGRGHKGQRSRSGARRGNRVGFEGGQMATYRHLPKIGFTNPFRKTYQIVNLKAVEDRGLEGEIGPDELWRAGLIKRTSEPVKILGEGGISRSITIRAQQFSRSALEKLEKAGGRGEVI